MRLFIVTLLATIIIAGTLSAQSSYRVLIFSKTNGFRHESIPEGIKAITGLCEDNNIAVDHSEDSTIFNDDSLKKYNALIFLNTTGELFNENEKEAFKNYIHHGGAWLGIHSATDTEFNWPWYGKLAGAYFTDHPEQQEAVIKIVDKNNPATRMLPDNWKRFGEWYNYKDVSKDLTVLGYLDESSYKGGKMGGNHPFIWYHHFEGGMAFYTGCGHTKESYKDPLFLAHLLGAIKFVITSPK